MIRMKQSMVYRTLSTSLLSKPVYSHNAKLTKSFPLPQMHTPPLSSPPTH